MELKYVLSVCGTGLKGYFLYIFYFFSLPENKMNKNKLNIPEEDKGRKLKSATYFFTDSSAIEIMPPLLQSSINVQPYFYRWTYFHFLWHQFSVREILEPCNAIFLRSGKYIFRLWKNPKKCFPRKGDVLHNGIF